MSTPRQAMDIITGLLFRTCFLLAAGELNAATSHERMAYAVYQRYYNDQKASWGRMGLPPFKDIKNDTTKKCIEVFPERLSNALKLHLKALEEQNKKDENSKQE